MNGAASTAPFTTVTNQRARLLIGFGLCGRWRLRLKLLCVGGVWIDGQLAEKDAHRLHRCRDDLGVYMEGPLQPCRLRLYRMREPGAAIPKARREQGHAGMVAAVQSDHLNVGEAIAEGRNARARRAVAGENRVAAGRDIRDLHVPASSG